MIKTVSIGIGGLLAGIVIGYFSFFYSAVKNEGGQTILSPLAPFVVKFELPTFTKKEVIGFLPFWLLSKAKENYSPYITTLTYFSLTVGPDGSIVKKLTPLESEPGWFALTSGKVTKHLDNAKKHGQKLSLLVFAGNDATIGALMENPVLHARNLIRDVKPIMDEHKFTDLNLDIENVSYASESSQRKFTQFVQEVKKGVNEFKLGTLSIDISADALIRSRLIHLASIASSVDHIILMTYDYHYIGSQVSGPVAPLFGAGTVSEYDTQTAVELAASMAPKHKLILGVPLYGYEWETLRDATRSATIPSSGLTASTARVEKLLYECTSCTLGTEFDAREKYLTYLDEQTNTYHQIFYPDTETMQIKIDFAKKEKLGGLALWALGYESSDILEPLKTY